MNNAQKDIVTMFNYSCGNTWVFTGGENVQGGWNQTRGARNFIGHFEEHIRWEKRHDSYVGTRERYTINTAKIGQTVEDVNKDYEVLVRIYHPRAVAIMVGKEDYAKGEAGVESFKKNLGELVAKIKDMKAIPVLQTPVPAKQELLNIEAKRYTEVVIGIAHMDSSILLIDHFNKCIDKKLSYLDGQLDQEGHLEIAEQLMNDTIGDHTTFNLGEVVDTSFRKNESWDILDEDPNAHVIRDLIENNIEKSLRWLFLGDSITHGALHTHGYDSLPQLFEKFIRDEKGRINDVFINTAVSGATTKDQIVNSKARFEDYRDIADIVFIMFGTNDAVSDVTLDDFRVNLKRIISDIKEIGAIPVLRAPNPCEGAPRERGVRIIPYIKVIEECAQEEQVVLINHYKQWIQAATKYPDIIRRGNWIAEGDGANVHPGTTGQLNMFHAAVQRLGLWNAEGEMEKLAYKIPVYKVNR